MKQLFTLIVLALFAFAMPLTGYSQDSKAKTADKAKQDTKAKPDDKGKAAEEIIDINTATAAQLMTLDGIGEARAAAIIKGRPYKAKNQLVSQKILPDAAYEKIKDRMIARQPTTKK